MSTPGFFDARPLIDPVDDAEVARFGRAQNSAESSTMQIVVWVIVIVMAVGVFVPVFGTVTLGIGYALGQETGVLLAGLLDLVIVGGATALIVFLVHRTRTARALAGYRLSTFATANAMTYLGRIDAPPLPGLIYGRGRARAATDVVRGTVPRFVEFGNYQYTTSSGENSTTHRWGYVAIKLDVPLPHIILDALSDNTLGSDVAAGISSAQRLSLEGDFDKYFALYCPAGYEADALYVFTPDVMARLIDNLAQLNIEIVDDWMFFYSHRPLSTTDPATWAWLFGAVAAMMTKLEQWARWRDDRLRLAEQPIAVGAASALPFSAPSAVLTPPPPGVAPPGRRLRARSPWLVVAVVGVVVAVLTFGPMALSIALGFFGG